MLTRSSGYEGALARPHQVYTRVDVYSGTGVLLESDLPFVDGSVNATLTSRVARRLNLTLSEEFYPVEATDLMAPFGNEVRAFRGIIYGDGSSEFFPVFRGRIDDIDLNDEGQVSLSALDRAADVVAAGFEGPEASGPDHVADGYRGLVLGALPDAEFVYGFEQGIWESYPRMIWESDRGQAADDLADAAGAFWFPVADGRFTMIKIPWTQDNPTVFTLRDGPLGTVERSQVSRSRESIFNVITVYAERVDGTEPVVYTARDQLPTSPTFVDGNFGVRTRQVSVQAALNQAQAQATAEALLRRAKALTETWALEIVPDASIELGDTFALEARGRTAVQVVAGFTLPLVADGTMSLECRAQVVAA